MPPKLRKDKLVQNPKPIPTPTTNQYDAFSEHRTHEDPPKTTTPSPAMSTPTLTTPDPNYQSLKNHMTSMAAVLQSITTSLQKMDKLDKIDIIKSRQKSTNTKLDELVSNLSSENGIIKATTNDPNLAPNTPSYATILKTSQKQNKNDTENPRMTPNLTIIKPPSKSTNDTSDPTKVQALVPITNNNDTTNQSITLTVPTDQPPSSTQPQLTTTATTKRNIAASDPAPTKSTPHEQTTTATTHAQASPGQNQAPNKQTPPSRNSNNTTIFRNVPMYTSPDIDDNEPEDNDDEQSSTNTTLMVPTKTHKFWRLAASEAHQPHRFLKFMDNIKLNGDTISNLRQFYKRIRLAFHSSFTKPVDILPPFRDISPNHSFIHSIIGTRKRILHWIL